MLMGPGVIYRLCQTHCSDTAVLEQADGFTLTERLQVKLKISKKVKYELVATEI